MYIVHCADNSLYTGYTNHLEQRMAAHNNGTGAKYTKYRRPIRLLYAQEFDTKSDALKAEYAFKQKTRAQKNAFLHQKGISITHSQSPRIDYLSQEENE